VSGWEGTGYVFGTAQQLMSGGWVRLVEYIQNSLAAANNAACSLPVTVVCHRHTGGRLAAAETAAAAAAAGDGLVTTADFAAAMHKVGPSIVRGAAVEVAPVQWGEVGGYTKVKQRLQQAVEWPLQHAGKRALVVVVAVRLQASTAVNQTVYVLLVWQVCRSPAACQLAYALCSFCCGAC
jgi:hypothetical protein